MSLASANILFCASGACSADAVKSSPLIAPHTLPSLSNTLNASSPSLVLPTFSTLPSFRSNPCALLRASFAFVPPSLANSAVLTRSPFFIALSVFRCNESPFSPYVNCSPPVNVPAPPSVALNGFSCFELSLSAIEPSLFTFCAFTFIALCFLPSAPFTEARLASFTLYLSPISVCAPSASLLLDNALTAF